MTIPSDGKDVEQLDSLTGGRSVMVNHHRKQPFLTLLVIHLPYDNHNPRQLSQRNGSIHPQKDKHMNVHRCFIHNSQKWKRLKYVSTGQWIN